MEIPYSVQGRAMHKISTFNIYYRQMLIGSVQSENIKTAETELKDIAFNTLSSGNDTGRIFNIFANSIKISHIRLYDTDGKQKIYYFYITYGGIEAQFIVEKVN